MCIASLGLTAGSQEVPGPQVQGPSSSPGAAGSIMASSFPLGDGVSPLQHMGASVSLSQNVSG